MAKSKKQQPAQQLSPENYIRLKARNLPIHECWLNTSWKESGTATILIARKHANGNITVGSYIVDLLCQGVYETNYAFNMEVDSYNELRDAMAEEFETTQVSYELVHNIIFAANEFAAELGLKPSKIFTATSQYILKEDTDDIELIDIECGRDGKPLYVVSHDHTNSQRNLIISQLEKAVGKGNFTVIDKMDTDEYEDEELEEDDKLFAKYSKFSFEEQKELFLELRSKVEESLTTEENKTLFVLTDLILFDLCDEQKVDDLIDSWEAETEITVSENDFTPEFLDISTGKILSKQDIKMLDEVMDLLAEDIPALESKLPALRQKFGETAFTSFIELSILSSSDKDAYNAKLAESYNRFPYYPLFRAKKVTMDCKNSTSEKATLMPDVKSVFEGRKSITAFELDGYLYEKIQCIMSGAGLDELEAFFSLIDDIDLSEDSYNFLKSIMMMMRIQLLKDYFEIN